MYFCFSLHFTFPTFVCRIVYKPDMIHLSNCRFFVIYFLFLFFFLHLIIVYHLNYLLIVSLFTQNIFHLLFINQHKLLRKFDINTCTYIMTRRTKKFHYFRHSDACASPLSAHKKKTPVECVRIPARRKYSECVYGRQIKVCDGVTHIHILPTS